MIKIDKNIKQEQEHAKAERWPDKTSKQARERGTATKQQKEGEISSKQQQEHRKVETLYEQQQEQ